MLFRSVAQQFDAGIRMSDRVDRDMIAVKVTDEWRYAIVGAPSYFAARGTPKHPEDLAEHNCIRIRLPSGALMPWYFRGNDKMFDIRVSGSLIVNDGSLVRTALLDGVGLAQVTFASVSDGIKSGKLVAVLEDWTPANAPFALYYPSRRQTPAALQALIDFLRKGQRGHASSG